MLQATRRQLVAGTVATTFGSLAQTGSALAQSKPDLNIVNSRGNSTVTLQELIERQGFFKAVGVTVQDTFVVDGARIMPSLLSGENDVCVLSGVTAALSAIEKGAQVKLIAGALLKPEHAVYTTRKDILTLEDLKGKTVGVGSLGSLLHEMMVGLFLKYKMDYSSVRFVNVGSSSDVFRAIAAGTVDAGVSEIDVYNQQAKYGVHTIKEGDLWKELPDFIFQATFASNEAIKSKREKLVSLLVAYGRLYRFLTTAESKAPYLAAAAAALGEKNLPASEWQWEFFRDAGLYSTDLLIPPASLDYLQKLNVLVGSQKSVLPFESVTDMSLAREALARI